MKNEKSSVIRDATFLLLLILFISIFTDTSYAGNKGGKNFPKNVNDALEAKIDISFQETPISMIFTGLSEVLGMNIAMNPGSLSQNLTISMKGVKLKEILDHVALLSDMSWKISGNTLIIADKMKIPDMNEDLISNTIRLNNRNVDEVAQIAKDNMAHIESLNFIQDKKTNSLYVTSKRKDMPLVMSSVRKIDETPADQMMIDVIFLEARVNKDESGGLSWKWDSLTFSLPEKVGVKNFFQGPITKSAMDIEMGISSAVSSGKAKVLNSTRILVQSGTSAKLSSGEETPIITNDLEKGPSTEFKSTGVQLSVEPYVRGDGNIYMKLTPSFSEVTGTVKTQMTEAPIVSNRSVETETVLRDGEWFVIGGLMRERVSSAGTGLPTLKDLPLVGGLFKGSTESVSRTQTIIFIRPILKGTNIPPRIAAEFSPDHEVNDIIVDNMIGVKHNNDKVGDYVQQQKENAVHQEKFDSLYKQYINGN